LARLFDPGSYLGMSSQMIDAVLDSAKKIL
jgi:hypothetical protein